MQKYKNNLLVALVVIIAVFAAAMSARAVTTVGNNVLIGGTLEVTGSSTLNGILNVAGEVTLAQAIQTSGSPTALTITGGAHTNLTASTEAVDVLFNLGRTVQFAAGNLASQRAMVIQVPTYAFAGASTITNASALVINGAPQAGINATITNAFGLVIPSNAYASDGAYQAVIGMPGISDGTGAVTSRVGLAISDTGSNVSLGNQTATLEALVGLSLDTVTYDSTVNLRTVNNAVGIVANPPSSGSNVLMTNVAAGSFGGDHTQVSQTGFTYADIATGDEILTLTGTTNITSTPGVSSVNVGQITVTDASAVTVDNAASVYVAGAPVAAGSVTLANAYSLWVDDGVSRFDGAVIAGGNLTIGGGAAITKHLSATAVWDPANLAADGNVVSTTVGAAGAVAGDTCSASHNQIGTNDVLISCHIQTADTARVVIMNKTGGALDILSGTVRVDVWQH